MEKYVMINKRENFICVIFLFFLLFLSGCGHKAVYNSNNMEFISSQDSMDETDEINFETHQELKLIGVVDTYANANELTALFEDRDSLERMISFNQILNDQFEFYEIYNQPLQSKFYWNMDDSFLKCYDGVPIKNQEIEIDGENCFISTLNSFQLNLNAYNQKNDYMQIGRAHV